MDISKLFEQKKTTYSFEVFPPKANMPIESVFKTLEKLASLKPDFISVTYGAGASSVSNRTFELASKLKNEFGVEPLAHLIAAYSSKEDVKRVLSLLKENNVENILALRGDISPEKERLYDFTYASDLVAFIKEQGGFNVTGACYPEMHPESTSLEQDIKNTKIKVDAGATMLTSQLFLDNEDFFKYVELARKEGIKTPILAGIMPIVKTRYLERTITLSGGKIPAKFSRLLAKFGDNERAFMDAGIAYATEQIIDLISAGVDGIHLYVMNNSEVAEKITNNISEFLR